MDTGTAADASHGGTHRADGLTRRTFLAGLAACGLAPQWVLAAADGARTSATASGFPESVPLYTERFENWSGEFAFDGLPTCAPQSAEDVLAVARWAGATSHRLRPRGAMHGWSPLSTGPRAGGNRTNLVLADTRTHLTRMEITAAFGLPAVRVEAGALLEDLLAFVEAQGFGFTATPAVGAITIGGMLAINGHGAAIPALGERRVAGQTFGSMSNRILRLTAVVWSERRGRYVLREFDRTDPAIDALLVNLGRTFVVDVTLALEADRNLRCESHTGISADELFASPGSGGRDIASFLDRHGRIEAIWYPYTDYPWLKVWSISEKKPALARRVTGPYNYPFSDNLPAEVVGLVKKLVSGEPEVAPLFGRTMYAVSVSGLAATLSADLWGKSKNTMLFIKPTTLSVHEASSVVITRRDRVQRVIADFAAFYRSRIAAWKAEGRYPVNMPVEIRVTGLDHASDLGIDGARPAALSAIAPRDDRPEWDAAVWLGILTIPGTPGMFEFLREIEQWMRAHYDGSDACVRPEWSKGWAYTNDAGWSDRTILREAIPGAFPGCWGAAVRTLDALDPKGVFRSSTLDQIFPRA